MRSPGGSSPRSTDGFGAAALPLPHLRWAPFRPGPEPACLLASHGRTIARRQAQRPAGWPVPGTDRSCTEDAQCTERCRSLRAVALEPAVGGLWSGTRIRSPLHTIGMGRTSPMATDPRSTSRASPWKSMSALWRRHFGGRSRPSDRMIRSGSCRYRRIPFLSSCQCPVGQALRREPLRPPPGVGSVRTQVSCQLSTLARHLLSRTPQPGAPPKVALGLQSARATRRASCSCHGRCRRRKVGGGGRSFPVHDHPDQAVRDGPSPEKRAQGKPSLTGHNLSRSTS